MKLIINADDLGLCRSVNEAILDVFRAGNLTSTTMMVNMPGTEHAAKLAKENPGLAIGLHFTLTEGKPLTGAPSLTHEGGHFLNRWALIRRILSGKANAEEITLEFRAQLRRLQDLGITPTHFDSHQHLHMVPAIFRAIRPVADESNLAVRIVVPTLTKGLLFKRPVKWLKQKIHQRNYKKLIHGGHFKHNDQLVSIHDYATPQEHPSIFGKLVAPFETTAQTVELFIHPYKDAADLYALYPDDAASHQLFFEKCFLEYKLLTSKQNLFSRYQLSTFGDL